MDYSSIWISLKTATVSTAIVCLLGILAARYIVFTCKKGSALLDGLFNLPLILPPTVVGFFLLVLFGNKGIFGKLLMNVGIQVIFSWGATVIAAAVVSFPLMYKTLKTSFEQIDMNLVRAGRSLGSSEQEIFRRIILPLSWPGIVGGCVISFARAIGEFGATLMIAGNIPGKTQTIPVAIYFAMESGNMGKAYLLVAIITAISLFATYMLNIWLIRQRRFVKK